MFFFFELVVIWCWILVTFVFFRERWFDIDTVELTF